MEIVMVDAINDTLWPNVPCWKPTKVIQLVWIGNTELNDEHFSLTFNENPVRQIGIITTFHS